MENEAMKNVRISGRVTVYDRYRFAIPVKGVVCGLSSENDGVEVILTTSNNPFYPIGGSVWVSRRQLRKDKNK